jgi:hypothetical protein
MRILSTSERKTLQPPPGFPLTKRDEFIPAVFHIPTTERKTHPNQRLNGLHSDAVKQVLHIVQDSVDLQPLLKENESYLDWRQQFSSFELSEYSFPETIRTIKLYTKYGLVPLSRLVSRKELEKVGVKAEPGFLYLAVNHLLQNGYGSRLLGEPELGIYGYKHWQEAFLKWETEVDPRWSGPIADVEICLNARRVYASPPPIGDEIDGSVWRRWYILATPLELPPGLVFDTAHKLKQMESELPTVSARFLECTMKEYKPPKRYSCPYDLPDGPPEIGEERRWIFSPYPWFVQHILFARALGGSYWKKTLQRAELMPDSYQV